MFKILSLVQIEIIQISGIFYRRVPFRAFLQYGNQWESVGMAGINGSGFHFEVEQAN